jgi:fermentation-respiration switch protein FrsA (DUF1100 family)
VHGSDDDVVAVEDARRLASNGGDGVDLRIVQNGGHRLRHDPRAIANLDPLEAAQRITPRPWLVVHGSDDDVVAVEDARRLAASGGDGADLRIVQNGGHRLRHDPRAIAMLLGWLDRQLV